MTKNKVPAIKKSKRLSRFLLKLLKLKLFKYIVNDPFILGILYTYKNILKFQKKKYIFEKNRHNSTNIYLKSESNGYTGELYKQLEITTGF